MLVHALRGRQRVKVPALYRNPAAKQALETHLASRPGVQSVRANVVTCTVLITFDGGRYARGMVTLVRRAAAKLPDSPMPDPVQRTDDTDPWHQMLTSVALQRLGVTRTSGLSRTAVKSRRARSGANVLPHAQPRSPLAIFGEQFRSLPVALLGASGLSLATGGLADGVVIGAVVLINAAIGFFTERSADQVIHGLGRVAHDRALVLREGAAVPVDPAEVVPGTSWSSRLASRSRPMRGCSRPMR